MASEQATKNREELMKKLTAEVETLKTTDGWRKWMQTASRFHNYSLNNQLLIAAQRSDATKVAGFSTWKSLGRSVKKGEKGIGIVAPSGRYVNDDERTMTSDVEDSVKTFAPTGFRVVYVFDVAQTEGEPLAKLDWPTLDMEGCDGMLVSLAYAASEAGFEVHFVQEHDRGTARGWYRRDDQSITIDATYPTADKCSTLIHELAHGLDPRCNGGQDSSKAERELVAETVAYIVGSRLGLPVEESATNYIAGWGANPKRLEKIAGDALGIASQIETLIAKVGEPISA